MGAADIVPGVSGGTIALILGIYERLIASVRTGAGSLSLLLRGDFKGFFRRFKEIEWTLVLPLLIGIAVAFVALSSIITRLLEEQPQAMAGLFFGLVCASIFVAWKLLEARDTTRLIIGVAVAIAAFFLLGLRAGNANEPSLIAFFLAGAIAICAMILPGISGSFLLLMMGMYPAFVGAVHERELITVAVFCLGALTGLSLFSTALNWTLQHHRDTLLAALIGLMAGSLRVLWPWPNGVGVIDESENPISGTAMALPSGASEAVVPVLLGLIAAAVVIGISKLGERLEH